MNDSEGNPVCITSWEIASLFLSAVIFSAWNSIATGNLRFSNLLFFLCLSLVCWLAGRLISSFFSEALQKVRGYNLCFLVGFFCVNTLAYLLQFLLPFTLAADMMLVGSAIGVLTVLKFRCRQIRICWFADFKSSAPAFIALILILLAASFWAQSSLFAVVDNGPEIIYKPWLDSYFHAHKINAFAASNGFNTISDMSMSGWPAKPYHYASYIMPAGLCAFTMTTAYQSFCGFMVPLGLLLSGLSAFVLVQSFWGASAGLAGCFALCLIPGPSQMGIHNNWFSYFWLQQIAPAGLYGVALIAVAWLFMFDGCKRGNVVSLGISWMLALVAANFKFHVFFANAYLLFLFPTLFFRGASQKVKVFSFILLSGLSILVTAYSAFIPQMPLVRFDGSSFKTYTSLCISMFDSNVLRSAFSYASTIKFGLLTTILRVSLMGLMLFVCTFGLFGLFYLVLLRSLRGKISLEVFVFPLLVIVNYLVMALGLGYDTRGFSSPSPEELLHRPFVWAYFVVSAWVGGAVWNFYLLERFIAAGKMQKVVFLTGVSLLLLVPLYLGKNIQSGPQWGKAYVNFRVPKGLVNCCEFIRQNSLKDEVVLDSHNDINTVVTALSERQDYVVGDISNISKMPLAQQKRLIAVEAIKLGRNAQSIEDFFVKNKINWYVLHPGETVLWPKELLVRNVYEAAGYKVYSFHR